MRRIFVEAGEIFGVYKALFENDQRYFTGTVVEKSRITCIPEQVLKDRTAASDPFIIQERWNGQPVCPHCGHDKIYDLSGGMAFKCANCKERFSVCTDTVMEGSRLPLQTWLLAIYIMTTARKGISSVQFAKELGVVQKTAWYLANRIRETCMDNASPLSGEVEIDETYIGGKERNKHKSKRLNAGRGAVGKQPVSGMRERGGPVRTMPSFSHGCENTSWEGEESC